MWWDSSEITLYSSVIFSIISVIVLYLVGSGFLRLISSFIKKVDAFGSFDLLQKINFRVVFGLIYIFVIILFFSLFNLSYPSMTLLVIALAVFGFVASRRSFKLNLPKKIGFKKGARSYFLIIIVFVLLLAVIFLSSMLITGLNGSTNDDGADHTLMISILLNHPNSLITRSAQPFADFTLYYPSFPHVICAFLATLLDVPIQNIVIMVSVFLPCLIVLSFYSIIKCIFDNKLLSILGSMIAAFFTTGLLYSPISWGGLPLLLSLYFSISSMALIYVFLLKKKMTLLNALILGVIFFIASQTYPIALLIISLWSLLILITKLLTKIRNKNEFNGFVSYFNRTNLVTIIVFLIPILFGIPYFYSIYTNNIAGHQFSQLNSQSNSLSETMKTRIGFNWLLDIPALSHFFSGFGQ